MVDEMTRAELIVTALRQEGVPADFVQSHMVYSFDNMKARMDGELAAFIWAGEGWPSAPLSSHLLDRQSVSGGRFVIRNGRHMYASAEFLAEEAAAGNDDQ